jgi:hypothetical protein
MRVFARTFSVHREVLTMGEADECSCVINCVIKYD